jgi:hypothetical protein
MIPTNGDPTSAALAASSAGIPPTDLSPESTFTESTRDQGPSRTILDTHRAGVFFVPALRRNSIRDARAKVEVFGKGFLDRAAPWLLG